MAQGITTCVGLEGKAFTLGELIALPPKLRAAGTPWSRSSVALCSELCDALSGEPLGWAGVAQRGDRACTGEGRDTDSDLYMDRRNYVWDNYSDTATLRNDHDRFIDDASWGHHHGGGRRH